VTSDEAAAEKVGKRAAHDEASSTSAVTTFVEEDANAEDAELSELRQASRRAMGLRETKKTQKSTLGSLDAAAAEASGKSAKTAASKSALRRRKPAGSKKKATVYPGGAPP
jgi:hypothetical protein